MKCPKCNKIINLQTEGGICIQLYVFCSPKCLFTYYTSNELKQLYYNK